MMALLTSAWLCLPLAPLNPTQQDTLAAMNLHVTMGATTPNHLVGVGPRLSVGYEALAVHPWVVAATMDYQYGSLTDEVGLSGKMHQGTLAVNALYYRGTDRLTAYLGGGPILRFGHVSPSAATSDSLWTSYQVEKVGLKIAPGYRLFLGLRFHRTISLEVTVNQVISDLEYTRRLSPVQTATYSQRVNLSSFSVTLGYIWELRRIW